MGAVARPPAHMSRLRGIGGGCAFAVRRMPRRPRVARRRATSSRRGGFLARRIEIDRSCQKVGAWLEVRGPSGGASRSRGPSPRSGGCVPSGRGGARSDPDHAYAQEGTRLQPVGTPGARDRKTPRRSRGTPLPRQDAIPWEPDEEKRRRTARGAGRHVRFGKRFPSRCDPGACRRRAHDGRDLVRVRGRQSFRWCSGSPRALHGVGRRSLIDRGAGTAASRHGSIWTHHGTDAVDRTT